jgi:hypothetical protein
LGRSPHPPQMPGLTARQKIDISSCVILKKGDPVHFLP